MGSRYLAPQRSSGLKALSVSASGATAGLGDGNLPQPLNVAVNLGANDVGTMVTPGAPDLSFRINPATGHRFRDLPFAGWECGARMGGVVLQKQNAAYGFFRGVNQSGYFALSPAN